MLHCEPPNYEVYTSHTHSSKKEAGHEESLQISELLASGKEVYVGIDIHAE